VVGGVVGLALWLGYELRPRADDAPAKATGGGKDVLLGTEPRVDSLAPLEQMGWADVAATLETVGRDAVARDRIIAETRGATQAPLRYLRGMLVLAKGDAATAAAILADIPAAEIPPDHLYAPYRMYDSLSRPGPNPFREPMRQAVAAGRTPAIVAARVAGREGEWPNALQAYLRTDPSQWTAMEVEHLGTLRRHAGLAGETLLLLKAALKSGRVPASIRPPLIALASAEGERTVAAQLQARVAEIMREDTPRRASLVAAVERQLQMRQRFLRGDHAGLIASHVAAVDINLPDETLLLLVLSSSQTRAIPEFERWSRELRRRFPDPSVESWLQTLQVAPPR
jgi:hypothetical protein